VRPAGFLLCSPSWSAERPLSVYNTTVLCGEHSFHPVWWANPSLSAPLTTQWQLLPILTSLGHDLQILLVGVGITEALRALQTDPPLAKRFAPATLPRWRLHQAFRRLLASFEQG